MHSTKSTPSRRGSLGENGSIAAAQRTPTSRCRLSFLERVDEADEREGLTPTNEHASQHFRRSAATMSPPELFSSDDEIENRHRQIPSRWSEKRTDQRAAEKPSTRRPSALPRRSSSRPLLQNLPRESHRTSRNPSRHAIATTLDENKHKKLVALFYWRRRTLETYIAAWKWVIFDTSPIGYPPPHTVLRPHAPAQVRPVPTINSYPRHDSALLRNTLDRQRRDSAITTDSPSKHRDRINSLRDEYRQLKASALEQQQTIDPLVVEILPPEEDANATRLAFKERLRVYYWCFSTWQEYVSAYHNHLAQLEEQAFRLYRAHHLCRLFHPWATAYLAICRSEKKRWRCACELGDRRAMRRRFRSWTLWYKEQQRFKQHAEAILRLRLTYRVSRWREWTTRTIRLHQADQSRRMITLRRYFARLKNYRIYRRQKELVCAIADNLNQQHATRRVWSQWCRVVFADDETTARMLSLAKILSQRSAVTKWKRFIARRRNHHALAEQADCCLYDGLLRRFWSRWMNYLSLRLEKLGVYETAARHWRLHQKRQAIRILVSHQCMRRYDRDRARAATESYLLRQCREALSAWRIHVQFVRQSRHFRHARATRLFGLCLMLWGQYAKRSRRLHALQAALLAQRRAKILMHSMQVWSYRYKLCSTYRLLDARYTGRLLAMCMRMWRSFAVKCHNSNQFIQRLETKRSSVQSRRMFSAWRLVVFGARCRRRLIRLFQKKQLCKKLRGCVRAMHLHAKAQRLQRVIKSRRVEGAWHAWAMFITDLQRRVNATTTATQFFATRRYSLAVDLWRQNTIRWCRKRRGNARAFSYLIDRIMRKSLYAWYRTSQRKRRWRDTLKMQTAKRQRSTLWRSLVQWKMGARASYHQRHKLHRLWYRAMLRRRKLAFFAWRVYLTHKKTHERVLCDAQHAFEQRLGRTLLHVWRVAAVRLKRHSVATRVLRSQRRDRVLRSVVCVWRCVVEKWHHDRLNNFRAAAFHREYLLLWVFYGWQHAALANQVVREKQRRVTEAIARTKIQLALSMWKTRFSFHQEVKAKLYQATTSHQLRWRRNRFKAWRVFVTHRQKRHQQTRRALAFTASNLKLRIYCAWLRFTSGTRSFKSKLRVIFQTTDGDIQRKTFRSWRRYKRTETLEQQADEWRQRSLLQTVWQNWRYHMIFTRKMRRNVLLTHRLLQGNAARASFTQWKKYITSRRQAAHALAQAEEHHRARCYRSVVRRFRVSVHHARTIELSVTFHGTHLKRQHFHNWRRGVVAQKARREQKASMIKQAMARRITAAFAGWHLLVRTKQQLLQSKAIDYRNALACKHTWKVWRRLVEYRHVVNDARSRQIHRALVASFQHWMEFVHEQQQIRRHVEAAVAHVDRVTMEKMWETWIAFRVQRRKNHRLHQIASSFYAIRILQQRCFRVWRIYVSNRHDRQAQQLRADAFCLMASLQRCLDRWGAYIAHRHARSEAKQIEDGAIRLFSRTRAIRKWRHRAATLRFLSQAQARAAQFVVRRIETYAVHSLRRHAVKTKRNRIRHFHAIAHRKHQLSRQCFMRWRQFISWRRRHQRFLRLFRSNQLSDYFALWLKYKVKNQCKRSLQATATRGYRELIQRRAFQCWYVRSRYWMDKRRAVEWWNQRLCRSVLAVWFHRVRVLCKMRHLFRFQDAYRLGSHFHMWKRFWWRKKQQVVRFHDAVVWFKKQRQAKCLALWVRWIASKRQEKATLQMATKFRARFFSRKYLSAWRAVITWKKRKTTLQSAALQSYQLTLYQNALKKLYAYFQVKKRICDSTLAVQESLTEMKVQRSVGTWKRYVLSRHKLLSMKSAAVDYHSRIVVQRCWSRFGRWHAVRCVKHHKLQRAKRHDDKVTCQRALFEWRLYVQNHHRLCKGLQRFKQRFFRGVTEDFFSRWASFVAFKRRLRTLKRKVERSSQLQKLRAWHNTAQLLRQRKAVLTFMRTRRDQQVLLRCVVHWESVTTERWMYSRLVWAARWRRERQRKTTVLQQWNSVLSMRQARRAWRAKARTHHRQLLVAVLQSWRRYTDENMDGSKEDGNVMVYSKVLD